MMRVPLKKFALCAAAFASLCWLSCHGGGTEIGSEGVVIGTLYQEDGSGAPSAVVRIVKQEVPELSKKAAQTSGEYKEFIVVTDSRGNIAVEKNVIADGYYSVTGEKGVLKSFTDSVLFVNGLCEKVYDTLRETGSLSGKIILQRFGDDPKSAMIYVFGARVWGEVYDNGNFTLPYLAEGRYPVRFDAKYDVYRSYDTVITITAGMNDTLVSPVILPYVIMITGFGYTIDTLMRGVTFYWDRIDTGYIGGYQLQTREKETWQKWVLLRDTSMSLYMRSCIEARVRPLEKESDDGLGNFTPSQRICPVDKFRIKTIEVSSDQTRTIGWTLSGGRLNVLSTSRYNPRDARIAVYELDGRPVSIYPLPENEVTEPLAIASKNDTLFILDKKSSETLCVLAVIVNDSVECMMKFVVPSNFGTGGDLEFGFDGKMFISQYLTTYIFGSDGVQLSYKNGLATHFALTRSALYTTTYEALDEGDSSAGNTDSGYVDLIAEEIPPKRVMKFTLDDKGNLDPAGSFECDKLHVIRDFVPKLFAANNSGTVCCLLDEGLFVYNENSRETKRVQIDNSNSIVDMLITEDDVAYLLYDKGRIDLVNLVGDTPETP
jgi:hypothetical protein